MRNSLHLVSNRLPVTVRQSQDGSYVCQESCGGLVTGLKGVSECSRYLWYGWPGLEIAGGQEADRLRRTLLEEHHAVPCNLEHNLAEKHYNGFSSASIPSNLDIFSSMLIKRLTNPDSVLWPLFHYQPGFIKFENANWRAYCEVNCWSAKSAEGN